MYCKIACSYYTSRSTGLKAPGDTFSPQKEKLWAFQDNLKYLHLHIFIVFSREISSFSSCFRAIFVLAHLNDCGSCHPNICYLNSVSSSNSHFFVLANLNYWAAFVIQTYALNSVWPVIRSGNIPGSAILAESQVVREAIRIPGSGIRLVYHSSRAKGFYSTIQLQLTPATVPQSLLRVHLQITIEGRSWPSIAYPMIFKYRISHLLHGRGSKPGSFPGSSARKKTKISTFSWTSMKRAVLQIRTRRISMYLGLLSLDLLVRGTDGSGSGSFCRQAKIVRKTLILLFCDFFLTMVKV